MSWGVDGRLCLWDSHSFGQIHSPMAILVDRSDYPIFAVDKLEIVRKSKANGNVGANENGYDISCIAVAGGRDGGFLGIPVYLYDVKRHKRAQINK